MQQKSAKCRLHPPSYESRNLYLSLFILYISVLSTLAKASTFVTMFFRIKPFPRKHLRLKFDSRVVCAFAVKASSFSSHFILFTIHELNKFLKHNAAAAVDTSYLHMRLLHRGTYQGFEQAELGYSD